MNDNEQRIARKVASFAALYGSGPGPGIIIPASEARIAAIVGFSAAKRKHSVYNAFLQSYGILETRHPAFQISTTASYRQSAAYGQRSVPGEYRRRAVVRRSLLVGRISRR